MMLAMEEPYDIEKLIVTVETLLEELQSIRKRQRYRKYYRKYRAKLKRKVEQKKEAIARSQQCVSRENGSVVLYFD